MSWDTAWQLPGPEVDRQAVEAAVQKALSEFPGVVRGSDIDEDLAEFAEDFAADEEVVEDRLEFALGLPEALVREHAEGRLEGEPDDDGLYWGEFSLTPGFDGGPAEILVSSGDAQNRECWGALFEVVERVAELLGAVAVAR
jgi:hypothetical protein